MQTMNRLFALAGFFSLLAASAATGAHREAGFADAMARAMERMMGKMNPHTAGDVDRHFVELMVPHHQGAIDMAVAELRYGRNVQLKRIAQEIIVEQQQEIAAMDLAVGAPPSKGAPAPTQQDGAGNGGE